MPSFQIPNPFCSAVWPIFQASIPICISLVYKDSGSYLWESWNSLTDVYKSFLFACCFSSAELAFLLTRCVVLLLFCSCTWDTLISQSISVERRGGRRWFVRPPFNISDNNFSSLYSSLFVLRECVILAKGSITLIPSVTRVLQINIMRWDEESIWY